MQALVVDNVHKTYANNVQALRGVNLAVQEGDFFALLGPNGAGKSTLISMITALVTKDRGSIRVFDHDIDRDLARAKAQIGVVPQEFNFNIFEKVVQIIVQQAGYYGLRRSVALDRAEDVLRRLDLWKKRDTQAMRLSGGMKRRLMIARALVHRPRLLILDEPTAGVDIELRRSMWDFVIDLNRRGTTIILTTHYLEEAENLCKNIAIIDHGEIIRDTSMKALLKEIDAQTLVLETRKKFRKVPVIRGFEVQLVDDHILEVQVSRRQSLNVLFQQLNRAKIEVANMRNKTNRLEELFVDLVGEGNSR